MISITSAPWTVAAEHTAVRGGPTRELICVCHGTVAERAGNARAIAAVPAMIAALQAMAQGGDLDAARERCRTALKQAGL